MTGSEPDNEVLRSLLAALPDIVLLVDEDREVHFINRSDTGGWPETISGEDVARRFLPATGAATGDPLDHVFETQERATHVAEVQKEGGGTARIEGTLIPIVREGRTEYVAIVTKDVTRRRIADRDPELRGSGVRVCAWCGSVQIGSGEWHQREGPVERRRNQPLTHGICPECEASAAARGN